MAGPWEKYQATTAPAEAGPWAKYQAAPPSAAVIGSQAVQPPDTPAQEAGHKLADVPYKSPMEFWQERQDALKTQMGGISRVADTMTGNDTDPPMGPAEKRKISEETTRTAFGTTMAPVSGKIADSTRAGLTRVPQINPGVADAHAAGYVLPPKMASESPGLTANTMAAWSGKTKLAQEAGEKNQVVTTDLAHKALGVPADKMLTEQVFDDIRAQAGQAYDEVRGAIPRVVPDRGFRTVVSGLGQANTAAAKTFPNLMRNAEIETLQKELAAVKEFTPEAGIGLVKDLRFRAKANLRSPDPAKIELGFAQREAADAVDELVERNIEAAARPQNVTVGGQTLTLSQGNPAIAGLVQKYREARQLIAKTYDVESVTNTATGDVSARGLAAMARRGKPLTGELKTIADAANAFPKALQNPSAFGGVEPLSVLDFYGAGLSVAHGNPGVAGMFLARPLARKVALSDRMQRRMIEPRSVGQPTGGDLIPMVPPLSQSLQPKPLSETAEEADGR